MDEHLDELRSDVELLESRLATARLDLERIRARTRKGAPMVALFLPLIALSTVLIAAAPIPNVVTAPFRVMDSSGKKKIFEIHGDAQDTGNPARRGFSVYDSSETEVLAAVTEQGHSYLEAGASIDADVRMGVIDALGPAFTLRKGGQGRISMAVTNGEPMLNMTNDNNIVIMDIGQNESKGGVLLLTDAKGQPMVKFSTSTNGAGTVVTFPNAGAGGAIAGLKGTMLCGRGGCGK